MISIKASIPTYLRSIVNHARSLFTVSPTSLRVMLNTSNSGLLSQELDGRCLRNIVDHFVLYLKTVKHERNLFEWWAASLNEEKINYDKLDKKPDVSNLQRRLSNVERRRVKKAHCEDTFGIWRTPNSELQRSRQTFHTTLRVQPKLSLLSVQEI